MQTSKLAIVILNWNGQEFLSRFLPMLVKYKTSDSEIIIADNASTDNSMEFLKKEYPTIRIILNKENGGFAKGYNDALLQIDAKYYVLLNSDIEVTENWIQPVIELMDSDERIAACQPKLLSCFEKTKFEYAGAAGGFIDKLGYPFCRGRIFDTLEEDKEQYHDNREIFWATGACLFVRADAYWSVDGMDNDFFAHMEEVDLCWRLKNKGYKIMFCCDSKVYHIGGGTLPKSSSRKTFLNFRNNLILLYKNLSCWQFFKVYFVRIFLDIIAALKFLSEGHFSDFIAVAKAHFVFYFTFYRHRRKRTIANLTEVSGIYKKSIVLEYYLRKKKTFTILNLEKFTK